MDVGEMALRIPGNLTVDSKTIAQQSPFADVSSGDWWQPEEPFMVYWSWLLRQPRDTTFSAYARLMLSAGYYCPDADDPVPEWATRLAPRIDCTALPFFTGTCFLFAPTIWLIFFFFKRPCSSAGASQIRWPILHPQSDLSDSLI
jgi:hypothetical protein